MLGFIEQTTVADIVAAGMTLPDGRVIPPGGPAGWFGNPAWIPWRTQIPTYLCPSDLNPGVHGNHGGNSYAFSVGDSMGVNWNDNNYNDRGPFGTHLRVKRFRDCIDGPNADSTGGALSAGSYHPGGVNVLLMDGSVRFVSETIDTGNTALPPVTGGFSPYGVWGSMGSRAGGEPVSLD